jgi:hypothetical protein
MKKLVTLILLATLYFPLNISAQIFPEKKYPQGYFRNPLGVPLQLSANFGELRTNHYHMGFDIRTAQRENLPVYAAAEGYISRVKIEKGGFGRAIYITHPNGYTTLYAHLNDFTKELDAYIKERQYEDEQWEQDRFIPKNLFPVIKGQFIAYSGNTGASGGPHLHFEIRDTETENNLNPWLFNFALPDNIPPVLYALYLYDRRYSTYQVNPLRVGIRGAKGAYTSLSNEVIVTTPEFSFGVTAEDKTNTSPFLFGIFQAEFWLDDTLQSAFRINDFSYGESRYINGSIDYKSRLTNGRYIQHLSQLPGNNMNIYRSDVSDGVVVLNDTLVHNALINLKDAAGNTTSIHFKLRYDPTKKTDLLFTTNSIPLQPNKENNVKLDDIEVFFTGNSFYDVVPFVVSSQQSNDTRIVSNIHQLSNYTIPVHDSFTVRIKSTANIPDSLKDRVIMQLLTKGKKVAVKNRWGGDWMTGKFREFGTVQLRVDTNPPILRPVGFKSGSNLSKAKSITFIADDSEGDLKKFRAELNGKWLRFSRRSDYLMYTFDERCPPGLHELKVRVEDVAGNITERTYSFTR